MQKNVRRYGRNRSELDERGDRVENIRTQNSFEMKKIFIWIFVRFNKYDFIFLGITFSVFCVRELILISLLLIYIVWCKVNVIKKWFSHSARESYDLPMTIPDSAQYGMDSRKNSVHFKVKCLCPICAESYMVVPHEWRWFRLEWLNCIYAYIQKWI